MGAFDVFPMPADANYSYAQAFDRRQGGHHGTDVFAPRGTPLLAVFDGDARAEDDELGGNVVYLQADGPFGRKAYYAHLDSIDPSIGPPGTTVHVQAGQVLGYVGNTGNAQGKAPHLHLQVTNPDGRSVADPFPHLVEVDPKRGGAPVDPTKPPDKPPLFDVDASSGAIIFDEGEWTLIGIGAAVLLAAWLFFRDNGQQQRREA